MMLVVQWLQCSNVAQEVLSANCRGLTIPGGSHLNGC